MQILAATNQIEEFIMSKKLVKSKNKIIAGVCAGIAEYFNVDPTLVRVIWVLCTCIAGLSILAYLVCALIMPSSN